MVHVTFKIHYNTVIGQIIRLIGDIEELGEWKEGVNMVYHEGMWTVDVEINTFPFEFKFQVYNIDKNELVEWEACENRQFSLLSAADEVVIESNWNCPNDTKFTTKKAKAKKSTIKKSTSTEFAN